LIVKEPPYVSTPISDAAGHQRSATPRGRTIYRSVTFLTIFSMLFGGLLLLSPTGAGAQSTATTTDHLNLRSGPGTSYGIVATMPSGATVSINGAAEAGFYPLTYNGMTGYASGEWLSIGGAAAPVNNSGATGTAYVHSGALNLRSGPGTGYSIITVMPDSAEVQLTGEQGNGFLGVIYRGMSGYASADWLTIGGAPTTPAPAPSNPGSGSAPVGNTVVGTATVTAFALNVRSGPSTGYSIVGGVTSGTSVEIMGDPQGGFYPIRYSGGTGWVSGDYISMGGAAAPAPSVPSAPSNPGSGSVPVGDSVVNTATVTAGVLNMRSGPSTSYAVVTGMAYGAQVDVMGNPQGGFYPISYHGTRGWASGDYLTIGGVAAPSNPDSGNSDVISIIYAAADAYGQPRADMLRVARCESVLDPAAVNPYSGASGLFQFMPGTWRSTPFANEDIFDPVANANAAAWMWSVGRRNEWTCQ
jgi:uncharacterized protein YraI